MIRYRYENQVASLLLRKECVVIPKVGGFLVYAMPASIDPENQQILPPGKKLVFHAGLNDLNHVLAQTVADYYGIPLDSAKTLVDQESEKLAEALEAGRPVFIKGIGMLKDEGKGIDFEPCPAPESIVATEMGLQATALPPAIEEKALEQEETPVIKITPAQPTAKSKNWLKIAASLALPIALGAGFLFKQPNGSFLSDLSIWGSYGNHTYEVRKELPSKVDTQGETVFVAEEEISGEGIVAVSLSTQPIPVKIQPEAAPTHKFEIIGGCFKDLSNADTMVARFKKRGYPAFISAYRNNLYYVSIGKYEDRSAVKTALRAARKDLGLDLWYIGV